MSLLLRRVSALAIGLAIAGGNLASLAQPTQPVANTDTGKQPDSGNSKPKVQPDQRGTDKAPLIVKVLPTPKSADETRQESAESKRKAANDRVNLRIAGITAGVLFFQLVIFGYQGWQLRRTVRAMRTIADEQGTDTKAMIAASGKTAVAMERVAGSMEINSEAVKQSVKTQGEMAARQELVGELQTRAYATINYYGIVPQNELTGYRIEPRMQLVCNGLTPAYRIRVRSACDFLIFPLPDDFGFPLPDMTPAAGTGMLGPRNDFILSIPAPRIFTQAEIAAMKAGTAQRLYVWGIVTYDDAFGKPRYLKYAKSIVWMADGEKTMVFNTSHHNEAN